MSGSGPSSYGGHRQSRKQRSECQAGVAATVPAGVTGIDLQRLPVAWFHKADQNGSGLTGITVPILILFRLSLYILYISICLPVLLIPTIGF